MNFKLTSYALLAGVACLMASCLGDNDVDVTTYDDVSVTSVTFGKLTYERTTLSSKGEDSTYTYTYDAASYAIHVDQKNRTIYNTDSLPMGTKLDKMFLTVSTKNGGVALLKKNGQYLMVSSTDTLDLSSGNDTLTVFSTSGLYKRDYVVKFVAHQEMPDSFTWSKPAVVESIKPLSGAKALSCGNGVYVLGSNGANAVLYKSAVSGGVNFAECNVGATLGTSTQAVSDGANIYLYDGVAKTIYTSADGEAWTSYTSAALDNVKTVIAADRGTLYALSADNDIVSSKGNFTEWTVEKFDLSAYQWTSDDPVAEAKKFLPTQDFASAVLPVRMNQDMRNIVVVGNSSQNDKTAVVWNRVVDAKGVHDEPWAYSAFDATAPYNLPKMQGLSLATFNDKVLAIGSPYSRIYCSSDNGVNWKQDDAIVLPKDFSATSATMTVDANGIVWLFSADGGKVWAGRLHK